MNTTNAATPQSAGNPAGTVASAADAEAICAAIEQLMEPLKAVVEAETRYLKAMDIAEAELLQDDKKDLAGAYIREITRYKALAAEVRRLAPGQVEKLARKHHAFRASILENERILESLREVSASLIRKTAERMGERSGGPRTYSRSASTAAPSKAAAVAVNCRA